MKKKKKRRKMKKKKKEYNNVTLELSQEAPFAHKSVDPTQFKVPFDSNELYQSINIF